MLHLNIMTPVAKALIYNVNGEILLLRRSNSHPRFASHLDFPGGEIELGESEFLGVSREITEETGIVVAYNSLRYVYQRLMPSGRTYMIFSVKLSDIRPKISLSWEHDQYEWLTTEEIINRSLPPGVDDYYEFIFQYLINMNNTLMVILSVLLQRFCQYLKIATRNLIPLKYLLRPWSYIIKFHVKMSE